MLWVVVYGRIGGEAARSEAAYPTPRSSHLFEFEKSRAKPHCLAHITTPRFSCSPSLRYVSSPLIVLLLYGQGRMWKGVGEVEEASLMTAYQAPVI